MYGPVLIAGERSRSGAHIVLSMGAVMVTLGLLTALQEGLIDEVQAYIGFAVTIVGFNFWQTLMAYEEDGWLVVINPAVAATLLGSLLTFGIGNLVWILPDDIFRLVPGAIDIDYWTNYYLTLWALASVGLWIGYRSRVAGNVTASVRGSRVLRRWLRQTGSLRMSVALMFVVLSLLCRLLLIALGSYGYGSGEAELEASYAYLQVLVMGADAGKLALVAIALDYFSKSGDRTGRLLPLAMVVAYEVFFGLLSGFKSQVVMPVLVVGIVALVVTRRIPLRLILGAVCMLVFAFSLIEPFRALHTEYAAPIRDVTELADTVLSARSEVGAFEEDRFSFEAGLAAFLGSRLATGTFAAGLRYAAENPTLPDDAPRFLRDIFLGPIFAIVPRAIWPEKPQAGHGVWYGREVLGFGEFSRTSVGMSPITYLNFAGGALAVFGGFMVYGCVQRALFHGFISFGIGGMVVFLGLWEVIRGADSIYYTFVIGLLRLIPILIVAQYLLYRPRRLQRPGHTP